MDVWVADCLLGHGHSPRRGMVFPPPISRGQAVRGNDGGGESRTAVYAASLPAGRLVDYDVAAMSASPTDIRRHRRRASGHRRRHVRHSPSRGPDRIRVRRVRGQGHAPAGRPAGVDGGGVAGARGCPRVRPAGGRQGRGDRTQRRGRRRRGRHSSRAYADEAHPGDRHCEPGRGRGAGGGERGRHHCGVRARPLLRARPVQPERVHYRRQHRRELRRAALSGLRGHDEPRSRHGGRARRRLRTLAGRQDEGIARLRPEGHRHRVGGHACSGDQDRRAAAEAARGRPHAPRGVRGGRPGERRSVRHHRGRRGACSDRDDGPALHQGGGAGRQRRLSRGRRGGAAGRGGRAAGDSGGGVGGDRAHLPEPPPDGDKDGGRRGRARPALGRKEGRPGRAGQAGAQLLPGGRHYPKDEAAGGPREHRGHLGRVQAAHRKPAARRETAICTRRSCSTSGTPTSSPGPWRPGATY